MSSHAVHENIGRKLLEGKVAVIYGAGGGVGSAVAKAFARERAEVFLAGRTEDPLTKVAREISTVGGHAEISKVDALDPKAVEGHLNEIAKKTGRLDISFNLVNARQGQAASVTSTKARPSFVVSS